MKGLHNTLWSYIPEIQREKISIALVVLCVERRIEAGGALEHSAGREHNTAWTLNEMHGNLSRGE